MFKSIRKAYQTLQFELYVLRRCAKKIRKLASHAVHGRLYLIVTNRRLTGMPLSKLNSWNTYWLTVSAVHYYFTVRRSTRAKLKKKEK